MYRTTYGRFGCNSEQSPGSFGLSSLFSISNVLNAFAKYFLMYSYYNTVWLRIVIRWRFFLHSVIVAHLFMLRFLFGTVIIPYVLGSWVSSQPRIINASMTVCAFLSGIAMTSNHPVKGSIIVNARNVCFAVGVRTTNDPIRSTFSRYHGSSASHPKF